VTEPPAAGTALAVAGALTRQALARPGTSPLRPASAAAAERIRSYLLWMSNQMLATELARKAAASTQVV
jgi:hypothetical protein